MPRIHPLLLVLSLVLSLVGAAACGDDTNLPDPTQPNVVDTVTIGALVGTPISTPSGYSIALGSVRTDQTVEFEFAYNIQGPDDQEVFLPRAALGLPSTGSANPGLQRRDEPFDAITVARSNGYVTDAAVPIEVGQRFLVRSRVVCTALGVPLYAKLEILGVADRSVTFQVLANTNCGYKGLEPGLPDR